MISSITVQNDARDLSQALGNVVDNLPKEMRIVSWKTAKKTTSFIAKAVTSELSVAQRVIKKQMTQKRVGKTGAEVVLKKSNRISLKDFKARQIKKGVSYKISKSKGRKTIAGAFRGPRPGVIAQKLNGHVFKRIGATRNPIQKLYGPSPWGVFAINKMQAQTTPKVNLELRKQMLERLRFKKLKKAGVI